MKQKKTNKQNKTRKKKTQKKKAAFPGVGQYANTNRKKQENERKNG